jgi:hypothetical protein
MIPCGYIALPSHEEAVERLGQGNGTPLDIFVANNEPENQQEVLVWRMELARAITYAMRASLQQVTGLPTGEH